MAIVKVLITGAEGFLGNSLVQYINDYNFLMYQNPSIYGHNTQIDIISLNKKQLDITNKKQVDEFFTKNKIDIVLNTAAQGGKRKIVDKSDIVYNNLLMIENLYRHKDKFKFMINFGTGAELDREEGFEEASEEEVIHRLPKDYYGLSKNIIAKRIIDLDTNIHNFRLFNVFSELEIPDRFIKSNIVNYINKKSIVIHENRKFDFFYIQDIIEVILYYIRNYNKILPKTLNMVYDEKKTLLDVANFINTLGSHTVPIEIISETEGSSYTGNSQKLYSLGINFVGLEAGIRNVYDKLKNE